MSALDRAAELAVDRLTHSVYSPDEWEAWAGREVDWAEAEWCVRVHCEGALLSYVGVLERDARCNGRLVRIGGVGGVMTHPEARGRGYARLAVAEALAFLRTRPGLAFALLACDTDLIAYYAATGWREFTGRLLVSHSRSFRGVLSRRRKVSEFTLYRAMTYGLSLPGPIEGTLDLCGSPW